MRPSGGLAAAGGRRSCARDAAVQPGESALTERGGDVAEPGAGDGDGAGDGAGDGDGPGSVSPSALSEQLRRHVPADARERRSVAAFLAALDRLADPYDRQADRTHVTASAVVVGRRGTVLHLHRRLGRWLQPGGHVDHGESPAAAALREAQEETGLALAHPPSGPLLVHVDVHEAAQGHVHLDLRYLLLGPDTDPAPPSGESPEARWFGWEEAAALADEGLVTALVEARRHLAAPVGAVPRPDGAHDAGGAVR